MSVRPAPGATGAPPQWTGATGATGATGMGGMGGLGAARLAAVLAAGRAQEEATGEPTLSKGMLGNSFKRRASTAGKPKPATKAEVALAESTKKGGAAAPDGGAIPSEEPEEAPVSPKSRRSTRGKVLTPKQSGGLSEADSYNQLKAEGIKTTQTQLGNALKANKFGTTLKAKADATRADRKRQIEEGTYDFVKSELPTMRTELEAAIEQKRAELRAARKADEECEDKRKKAADAVATQIEQEYEKIIARLTEQLDTKNRLLDAAQSKNTLNEKELTQLKELNVEIARLQKVVEQNKKDAIDSEAAAIEAEKAVQMKKITTLTEQMQALQLKVTQLSSDEVAKDKTRQAKDARITELTKFIEKQKSDRQTMYEDLCKKLKDSLLTAGPPPEK